MAIVPRSDDTPTPKGQPSKRTLAKDRQRESAVQVWRPVTLAKQAAAVASAVMKPGEDVVLENVHDCLKKRIRRHERRASLDGRPQMTPEQWLALCDRYDNRCACCGAQSPLTVDHVIPVSRGGANTLENAQPLCRSCNSSKGTKKTDYRRP